MKKIRIGAVNWDASLPRDHYFGFYQTRSLSQAKYRSWVPYYATLTGEDRVEYSYRTVEEYERELRYALAAGIDYFAYVWYPTEGSLIHEPRSPRDCSHRVHELNYARRLYQQSGLKDRLGMCAILGAHPFADRDLEELTATFLQPYYEKVEGRPLVYVFGGYNKELIERLHSLCNKKGIPAPFTVPLSSSSRPFPEAMPLADALSAYAAVNRTDVTDYEELVLLAMENDRVRMETGKDIVPLFTVGWNPAPRIDRPTPWNTNEQGRTTYATVRYAPRPNATQLAEGAKAFAKHIRTDVGERFVGHILTFAWNEFEEGGYLCPTYTPEGAVNEEQVQAFAQAAEILRSSLDKL